MRSSSGSSGSSASSRTRWLKRSQESSRSRNRSGISPIASRSACSGTYDVASVSTGRRVLVRGDVDRFGEKLLSHEPSVAPQGERQVMSSRWRRPLGPLVSDPVSPRTAAESRALSAAMSAPRRVQRLIGGRPVMIDGQTLAPDIQVMLRLQAIARPRDEQIPFATMRSNMLRETEIVGGKQPIGAVRDLTVAGRPARLYVPSDPVSAGARPAARLLPRRRVDRGRPRHPRRPLPAARRAVRSAGPGADLPAGPEHPFPAAHDDADEGYRWVVDHAAELGVDPQRIGVGGDSGGGNLAASVALGAASDGVPLAWQLLIYPPTDLERDTQSLRLFGEGFYLTTQFMDRANARLHAAAGEPPRPADLDHPRRDPDRPGAGVRRHRGVRPAPGRGRGLRAPARRRRRGRRAVAVHRPDPRLRQHGRRRQRSAGCGRRHRRPAPRRALG